jgi:hypothetical protein
VVRVGNLPVIAGDVVAAGLLVEAPVQMRLADLVALHGAQLRPRRQEAQGVFLGRDVAKVGVVEMDEEKERLLGRRALQQPALYLRPGFVRRPAPAIPVQGNFVDVEADVETGLASKRPPAQECRGSPAADAKHPL